MENNLKRIKIIPPTVGEFKPAASASFAQYLLSELNKRRLEENAVGAIKKIHSKRNTEECLEGARKRQLNQSLLQESLEIARRGLCFLHFYNEIVKKKTNEFPFSNELRSLLTSYVQTDIRFAKYKKANGSSQNIGGLLLLLLDMSLTDAVAVITNDCNYMNANYFEKIRVVFDSTEEAGKIRRELKKKSKKLKEAKRDPSKLTSYFLEDHHLEIPNASHSSEENVGVGEKICIPTFTETIEDQFDRILSTIKERSSLITINDDEDFLVQKTYLCDNNLSENICKKPIKLWKKQKWKKTNDAPSNLTSNAAVRNNLLEVQIASFQVQNRQTENRSDSDYCSQVGSPKSGNDEEDILRRKCAKHDLTPDLRYLQLLNRNVYTSFKNSTVPIQMTVSHIKQENETSLFDPLGESSSKELEKVMEITTFKNNLLISTNDNKTDAITTPETKIKIDTDQNNTLHSIYDDISSGDMNIAHCGEDDEEASRAYLQEQNYQSFQGRLSEGLKSTPLLYPNKKETEVSTQFFIKSLEASQDSHRDVDFIRPTASSSETVRKASRLKSSSFTYEEASENDDNATSDLLQVSENFKRDTAESESAGECEKLSFSAHLKKCEILPQRNFVDSEENLAFTTTTSQTRQRPSETCSSERIHNFNVDVSLTDNLNVQEDAYVNKDLSIEKQHSKYSAGNDISDKAELEINSPTATSHLTNPDTQSESYFEKISDTELDFEDNDTNINTDTFETHEKMECIEKPDTAKLKDSNDYRSEKKDENLEYIHKLGTADFLDEIDREINSSYKKRSPSEHLKKCEIQLPQRNVKDDEKIPSDASMNPNAEEPSEILCSTEEKQNVSIVVSHIDNHDVQEDSERTDKSLSMENQISKLQQSSCGNDISDKAELEISTVAATCLHPKIQRESSLEKMSDSESGFEANDVNKNGSIAVKPKTNEYTEKPGAVDVVDEIGREISGESKDTLIHNTVISIGYSEVVENSDVSKTEQLRPADIGLTPAAKINENCIEQFQKRVEGEENVGIVHFTQGNQEPVAIVITENKTPEPTKAESIEALIEPDKKLSTENIVMQITSSEVNTHVKVSEPNNTSPIETYKKSVEVLDDDGALPEFNSGIVINAEVIEHLPEPEPFLAESIETKPSTEEEHKATEAIAVEECTIFAVVENADEIKTSFEVNQKTSPEFESQTAESQAQAAINHQSLEELEAKTGTIAEENGFSKEKSLIIKRVENTLDEESLRKDVKEYSIMPKRKISKGSTKKLIPALIPLAENQLISKHSKSGDSLRKQSIAVKDTSIMMYLGLKATQKNLHVNTEENVHSFAPDDNEVFTSNEVTIEETTEAPISDNEMNTEEIISDTKYKVDPANKQISLEISEGIPICKKKNEEISEENLEINLLPQCKNFENTFDFENHQKVQQELNNIGNICAVDFRNEISKENKTETEKISIDERHVSENSECIENAELSTRELQAVVEENVNLLPNDSMEFPESYEDHLTEANSIIGEVIIGDIEPSTQCLNSVPLLQKVEQSNEHPTKVFEIKSKRKPGRKSKPKINPETEYTVIEESPFSSKNKKNKFVVPTILLSNELTVTVVDTKKDSSKRSKGKQKKNITVKAGKTIGANSSSKSNKRGRKVQNKSSKSKSSNKRQNASLKFQNTPAARKTKQTSVQTKRMPKKSLSKVISCEEKIIELPTNSSCNETIHRTETNGLDLLWQAMLKHENFTDYNSSSPVDFQTISPTETKETVNPSSFNKELQGQQFDQCLEKYSKIVRRDRHVESNPLPNHLEEDSHDSSDGLVIDEESQDSQKNIQDPFKGEQINEIAEVKSHVEVIEEPPRYFSNIGDSANCVTVNEESILLTESVVQDIITEEKIDPPEAGLKSMSYDNQYTEPNIYGVNFYNPCTSVEKPEIEINIVDTHYPNLQAGAVDGLEISSSKPPIYKPAFHGSHHSQSSKKIVTELTTKSDLIEVNIPEEVPKSMKEKPLDLTITTTPKKSKKNAKTLPGSKSVTFVDDLLLPKASFHQKGNKNIDVVVEKLKKNLAASPLKSKQIDVDFKQSCKLAHKSATSSPKAEENKKKRESKKKTSKLSDNESCSTSSDDVPLLKLAEAIKREKRGQKSTKVVKINEKIAKNPKKKENKLFAPDILQTDYVPKKKSAVGFLKGILKKPKNDKIIANDVDEKPKSKKLNEPKKKSRKQKFTEDFVDHVIESKEIVKTDTNLCIIENVQEITPNSNCENILKDSILHGENKNLIKEEISKGSSPNSRRKKDRQPKKYAGPLKSKTKKNEHKKLQDDVTLEEKPTECEKKINTLKQIPDITIKKATLNEIVDTETEGNASNFLERDSNCKEVKKRNERRISTEKITKAPSKRVLRSTSINAQSKCDAEIPFIGRESDNLAVPDDSSKIIPPQKDEGVAEIGFSEALNDTPEIVCLQKDEIGAEIRLSDSLVKDDNVLDEKSLENSQISVESVTANLSVNEEDTKKVSKVDTDEHVENETKTSRNLSNITIHKNSLAVSEQCNSLLNNANDAQNEIEKAPQKELPSNENLEEIPLIKIMHQPAMKIMNLLEDNENKKKVKLVEKTSPLELDKIVIKHSIQSILGEETLPIPEKQFIEVEQDNDSNVHLPTCIYIHSDRNASKPENEEIKSTCPTSENILSKKSKKEYEKCNEAETDTSSTSSEDISLQVLKQKLQSEKSLKVKPSEENTNELKKRKRSYNRIKNIPSKKRQKTSAENKSKKQSVVKDKRLTSVDKNAHSSSTTTDTLSSEEDSENVSSTCRIVEELISNCFGSEPSHKVETDAEIKQIDQHLNVPATVENVSKDSSLKLVTAKQVNSTEEMDKVTIPGLIECMEEVQSAGDHIPDNNSLEKENIPLFVETSKDFKIPADNVNDILKSSMEKGTSASSTLSDVCTTAAHIEENMKLNTPDGDTFNDILKKISEEEMDKANSFPKSLDSLTPTPHFIEKSEGLGTPDINVPNDLLKKRTNEEDTKNCPKSLDILTSSFVDKSEELITPNATINDTLMDSGVELATECTQELYARSTAPHLIENSEELKTPHNINVSDISEKSSENEDRDGEAVCPFMINVSPQIIENTEEFKSSLNNVADTFEKNSEEEDVSVCLRALDVHTISPLIHENSEGLRKPCDGIANDVLQKQETFNEEDLTTYPELLEKPISDPRFIESIEELSTSHDQSDVSGQISENAKVASYLQVLDTCTTASHIIKEAELETPNHVVSSEEGNNLLLSQKSLNEDIVTPHSLKGDEELKILDGKDDEIVKRSFDETLKHEAEHSKLLNICTPTPHLIENSEELKIPSVNVVCDVLEKRSVDTNFATSSPKRFHHSTTDPQLFECTVESITPNNDVSLMNSTDAEREVCSKSSEALDPVHKVAADQSEISTNVANIEESTSKVVKIGLTENSADNLMESKTFNVTETDVNSFNADTTLKSSTSSLDQSESSKSDEIAMDSLDVSLISEQNVVNETDINTSSSGIDSPKHASFASTINDDRVETSTPYYFAEETEITSSNSQPMDLTTTVSNNMSIPQTENITRPEIDTTISYVSTLDSSANFSNQSMELTCAAIDTNNLDISVDAESSAVTKTEIKTGAPMINSSANSLHRTLDLKSMNLDTSNLSICPESENTEESEINSCIAKNSTLEQTANFSSTVNDEIVEAPIPNYFATETEIKTEVAENTLDIQNMHCLPAIHQADVLIQSPQHFIYAEARVVYSKSPAPEIQSENSSNEINNENYSKETLNSTAIEDDSISQQVTKVDGKITKSKVCLADDHNTALYQASAANNEVEMIYSAHCDKQFKNYAIEVENSCNGENLIATPQVIHSEEPINVAKDMESSVQNMIAADKTNINLSLDNNHANELNISDELNYQSNNYSIGLPSIIHPRENFVCDKNMLNENIRENSTEIQSTFKKELNSEKEHAYKSNFYPQKPLTDSVYDPMKIYEEEFQNFGEADFHTIKIEQDIEEESTQDNSLVETTNYCSPSGYVNKMPIEKLDGNNIERNVDNSNTYYSRDALKCHLQSNRPLDLIEEHVEIPFENNYLMSTPSTSRGITHANISTIYPNSVDASSVQTQNKKQIAETPNNIKSKKSASDNKKHLGKTHTKVQQLSAAASDGSRKYSDPLIAGNNVEENVNLSSSSDGDDNNEQNNEAMNACGYFDDTVFALQDWLDDVDITNCVPLEDIMTPDSVETNSIQDVITNETNLNQYITNTETISNSYNCNVEPISNSYNCNVEPISNSYNCTVETISNSYDSSVENVDSISNLYGSSIESGSNEYVPSAEMNSNQYVSNTEINFHQYICAKPMSNLYDSCADAISNTTRSRIFNNEETHCSPYDCSIETNSILNIQRESNNKGKQTVQPEFNNDSFNETILENKLPLESSKTLSSPSSSVINFSNEDTKQPMGVRINSRTRPPTSKRRSPQQQKLSESNSSSPMQTSQKNKSKKSPTFSNTTNSMPKLLSDDSDEDTYTNIVSKQDTTPTGKSPGLISVEPVMPILEDSRLPVTTCEITKSILTNLEEHSNESTKSSKGSRGRKRSKSRSKSIEVAEKRLKTDRDTMSQEKQKLQIEEKKPVSDLRNFSRKEDARMPVLQAEVLASKPKTTSDDLFDKLIREGPVKKVNKADPKLSASYEQLFKSVAPLSTKPLTKPIETPVPLKKLDHKKISCNQESESKIKEHSFLQHSKPKEEFEERKDKGVKHSTKEPPRKYVSTSLKIIKPEKSNEQTKYSSSEKYLRKPDGPFEKLKKVEPTEHSKGSAPYHYVSSNRSSSSSKEADLKRRTNFEGNRSYKIPKTTMVEPNIPVAHPVADERRRSDRNKHFGNYLANVPHSTQNRNYFQTTHSWQSTRQDHRRYDESRRNSGGSAGTSSTQVQSTARKKPNQNIGTKIFQLEEEMSNRLGIPKNVQF